MLVKTPAEVLPPTMESLVTVLRDRSLWPHGFEWNFNYRATCAIGLCEEIWGADRSPAMAAPSTLKKFNRTFCDGRREYWLGLIPMGRNRDVVTPEEVADRIEKNFL